MSRPSGATWNCRSGFGTCFRQTTTSRGMSRRLRIDAAPFVRVDDLADRDDVRGLAHVDLLRVVHLPDRLERVHHLVLELLVDLLLRPEELREVLHPLEVRHRDAAAIRED